MSIGINLRMHAAMQPGSATQRVDMQRHAYTCRASTRMAQRRCPQTENGKQVPPQKASVVCGAHRPGRRRVHYRPHARQHIQCCLLADAAVVAGEREGGRREGGALLASRLLRTLAMTTRLLRAGSAAIISPSFLYSGTRCCRAEGREGHQPGRGYTRE